MTPAQFWSLEMQNQQNQQAQSQQNTNNMMSAITQFAQMYQGQQNKQAQFEGAYDYLSQRNMLSPEINERVSQFVKAGDYDAATSYIAPMLSELDFGRKAMLAGRSGFFDGSGQWQMALRPEPVRPPNKEGYIYGGR
jgi:hypothetical protein